MKSPEEIKNALERCSKPSTDYPCNGCPYNPCTCGVGNNAQSDALVYIDRLEKQIDRMLMQMHGDCGVCKHKEAIGAPCVGCLTSRRNRPAWEYEGIPEDHGKEHPHD